MFAAASGARLAHRHAKPAIKKQGSASQIEGLQVHYKAFQLQQQRNWVDGPNLGPRAHARQSKQLSYLDLNARIPKLDFEGDGLANRRDPPEPASTNRNQVSQEQQIPIGKAAWQDRELGPESERHDSLEITSDGNGTHRSKQKEAHRRWVKRNRIHDSSVGDCSSDEEDIYGPYGVQSAAANALLYIGLGTMAIGTIIAFVGTGEKGFKTMELRLIGPSLVVAGVCIVILRIALCVFPFHCLKHKRKHKQKLKNTTNKQNSEDTTLLKTEKSEVISRIPTSISTDNRDITATVSFLECERAIEMKPISLPQIVTSPRTPSDISVTSLSNGVPTTTPDSELPPLKKKPSKFEKARVPKNLKNDELLLSPTALENLSEK